MGKTLSHIFYFKTRFEINENCSYSRFFKRIIIGLFVSQNWFQNSKGNKVKQPNISLDQGGI